jgi:TATA-box binding protein (TBP) (component of TFIID and TFIIIB)
MQQEENIHFTPYRVSTITCNADIGNEINLDLHILFQNIEIKESTNDNFIWIQHLKENEEHSRGLYPKKKRKSKSENKKSRFDNQITSIYRYNAEYMPNIKIFKNGNIQLTGIKDIKHPEQIVQDVIKNIIRIYNDVDKKIILTNENYVNPIERLQYRNFKIRMINTDFKIYQNEEFTERFSIRRKELHNILISQKYNNKSSFQPGIYQGVKLEYFWNSAHATKNGLCTCTGNCFGKNHGHGEGNCKKVTVAIFESGSILITGGITFEQVNDAYFYICNIIKDNKNAVKKKVLYEDIMAYGA